MRTTVQHVVQVLVSDRFSGTERIGAALALAVSNAGTKSTVVVPDGPDAEALLEYLRSIGLETLQCRPLFGAAHDLRHAFGDYFRLFRQLRPSVAHFHIPWAPAGWEGILAARFAGVPVIVRTDHNPIVAPLSRADALKVRAADRCTLTVVNVSAGNRRSHIEMAGRAGRKLKVIPNGTSTAIGTRPMDRARRRAEIGLAPDDFVVAMLAYLETRKGPLEFVRAASLTAELEPRARFVVFGDGPERRAAEELGSVLGLGDRLKFVGRISDSPSWLAAADCFALPSAYEGLSMALLEATALGLPVVAYRVDGLEEVFPSLQGCLSTTVGNTREFARLIFRVAKDQRLATEMRRRSLAGASVLTNERMVERYLSEVYSLKSQQTPTSSV